MNAFLISRDLGYGSLSLRITSRGGKKKQRQRRKQRIEFSPVSHSNPTPHPILRAHNKANVIEFRGDDRHTLPFNRSVSIYERTPAKKKKEIIFAILACAKRENSSGEGGRYTLVECGDSREQGGLEPRRIWQRSITDMRACRSLSDPVDAWPPSPWVIKHSCTRVGTFPRKTRLFDFSTPRDPTYRAFTIRNSLFTVKKGGQIFAPFLPFSLFGG